MARDRLVTWLPAQKLRHAQGVDAGHVNPSRTLHHPRPPKGTAQSAAGNWISEEARHDQSSGLVSKRGVLNEYLAFGFPWEHLPNRGRHGFSELDNKHRTRKHAKEHYDEFQARSYTDKHVSYSVKCVVGTKKGVSAICRSNQKAAFLCARSSPLQFVALDQR